MSDQAFSRKIGARLVEELASVLGAATGSDLHADPGPGPAAGQGWLIAVTVSGNRSGAVVIWMDAAGASAIAGSIVGDPQPAESDVADLLKEMAAQAAASVSLLDEYAGTKLALASVDPAEAVEAGQTFSIPVAAGNAAVVAVRADVSPLAQAAPAPGPAPAAAPTSTAVAPRAEDGLLSNRNPNLDVVLDVELPLIVRFGRSVMSLKQLSGLGPGSIVDMGRSPDDAVELMVSDQVIAYGEVVIVDGNYGLRITELVSRADRIRALEA
jgi:flagellar motor switch protein FliN/FliY